MYTQILISKKLIDSVSKALGIYTCEAWSLYVIGYFLSDLFYKS